MPLNPERVRLLRQFQELTQKELADKALVSQPSIADYEAGDKEPHSTVADAIAHALNVDPRFLFEPDEDHFTEGEINFRKSAKATKTLRNKVIAQAGLFGIVVAALRRRVPTLPKSNIPSFPADSLDAVEQSAEKARIHWGLGLDLPIGSMVDVLENAGVLLTVADSETAEKVDAFSRYGQTNVVVLNTAKGSASRSFFDTAHEAGHGVLSHHTQPTKPHEVKEEEAQRFAGSFLMPRRAFTKDFWSRGSIDWGNLLEMKASWGTSLAAILVRAYQLGLIDPLAYRSAYRQLSSRGWRTSEPEEPEPEFPKLFNLGLQQYVKNTQRGIDTFIAETFLSPALFAKVTGYQAESGKPSKVVSLHDRRLGVPR